MSGLSGGAVGIMRNRRAAGASSRRAWVTILSQGQVVTVLRLVLCMVALALAPRLHAQDYPVRPVRLVAPFAPGGGTDFIARLIARKLSERLGQQVIVENRPGAGGNLGAALAVRAAPDGHTLLLVAGSYTANPSLYRLEFDPVEDISPIIQLTQGPFIVAVHPDQPVKALRELVELARSRPGALSYGSAGAGSITHLATELFLDVARMRVVHVPYKGTGPALNDAMAGNVQLIFGSVSTTIQHIRSGRLRGLAVTTPARIVAVPELPTLSELGYPDCEVILWHGLVGPKGLPAAIVRRINEQANLALRTPDMESLLATDGVAAAGGTPAQFGALIRTDIQRWAKVVRQAKVKIE